MKRPLLSLVFACSSVFGVAACADDTTATTGTGTGGGSTHGSSQTSSGSMSTGSMSTGSMSTGSMSSGSMSTGSMSTGSMSTSSSSSTGTGGAPPTPLQTVFLIVMENHNWSEIKGSSSAPYINTILLPQAAHAEAYKTPPNNHPSEPNYIWLEAGDNLGVTDDNPPSDNHQNTNNHLTKLLDAIGVSWRAYAEDISGTDCPQDDNGFFAVRHVPQLFFDDVTSGGSTTSANCIAHVRPFTELKSDLSSNTVARYNFITPNLCDDMHGETFGTTCNTFFGSDLIALGDTWLSKQIPMIMASDAYQNGGVIFIAWDEGTEDFGSNASDGPIPLLVLSNKAKPGYAGMTPYTHSSMLRSVQEIFGSAPFIRDAANATDLSDLFTSFP